MAPISKAAATRGQAQTPPYTREPAFASSGGKVAPRVPRAQLRTFADYHAFRILRHPGDLSAHVARILLLARAGESSALHGAILDLFRVLGDKGLDLKRDLLHRCLPLLDEAAHQQLRQFLRNPLQALEDTAGIPGLISASGDGPRLAVPVAGQGGETEDPVAEAEDHLQYGNPDAAISVLRARLLDDPADERAGALLVEILRHAGDRELARKLRRESHDGGAARSRWWRELGLWLGEAG